MAKFKVGDILTLNGGKVEVRIDHVGHSKYTVTEFLANGIKEHHWEISNLDRKADYKPQAVTVSYYINVFADGTVSTRTFRSKAEALKSVGKRKKLLTTQFVSQEVVPETLL